MMTTPAPRITRCIGKSSEVKSGRRAQYSSKKSKPMDFAPLARSHSADSGGNHGDWVKYSGHRPYIRSVQSVRSRTMSPGFTSSAPPRRRSSIVTPWFGATNVRSTTIASPITWSSEISAVVMPSLKTWSGESMWAPVWRLWRTLDTCQKPGPRRCGVTSSRRLVEGGLSVVPSTVTERSMYRLIPLASGGASRQPRDGPRRARQLDDGEPRVRPVREVDESAIVHLDVVGLDGHLAAVGAADLYAARGRVGRRRRDVEADLSRVEGIPDVHGPHTRVEVRDEDQLAVV